MTRRIECVTWPKWDGAELLEYHPPRQLKVRDRRGWDGFVFLGELRTHPGGAPGLVGVDEAEPATLYGWSSILREWIPMHRAPVTELRAYLSALRREQASRALPLCAVWIRPNRCRA